MTRATTIIGLVQLLLIVLGYFALAIIFKMWGYPNVTWIRWNSLALFLRQWGLLLLLVPIVWTAYAVVCCRRERYPFDSRIAAISGVAAGVIFLAAFMYGCFHPVSGLIFENMQ